MDAKARAQAAKEERKKKWASLSKTTNSTADGNKPEKKKTEDVPSVDWRKLSTIEVTDRCKPKEPTDAVPLILLTVDTPSYRARYEETRQHLEMWQKNCSCCSDEDACTCIRAESCDMLDLGKFPTMGVKRIVFEGWRKVFLPKVSGQEYSSTDFVLAAEDDIRIPDHVSPWGLVQICRQTFQANPDLDILSLGHSWKAVQKTQKRKPQDDAHRDLLVYLQSIGKGAAGVHGATLFAIRNVQRLQQALDLAATKQKQTHFDQFLFFSPLHNLQLALSDPPLVGWAEVDTTLTKSSMGHRRWGGGRWGFLPSREQMVGEKNMRITWIQRVLGEGKKESTP